MNYEMPEGWKRADSKLHINPSVYVEQFCERFPEVYEFSQLVDRDELTLRFYEFLSRWLELEKSDHLAQEIKNLRSSADLPAQAAAVTALIKNRYGLV